MEFHPTGKRLAIVTYGTGVVTAIQAQKELKDRGFPDVTVIDSPYLSSASQGLLKALPNYDSVLFVDICKVGQHPFASIALESRKNNALKNDHWDVIGAAATYNPLGQLTTFVSKEDVVSEAVRLLGLGGEKKGKGKK